MPSRAWNQFNALYTGIENWTNTGSVPKAMRNEYGKRIEASIAFHIGKQDWKTGSFNANETKNTAEKVDYTGEFYIETYKDGVERKDVNIPKGVTLKNSTLHVPSGRVSQQPWWFDTYADGEHFLGIGYSWVKSIKDTEGNTLRENWNQKNKWETHSHPTTLDKESSKLVRSDILADSPKEFQSFFATLQKIAKNDEFKDWYVDKQSSDYKKAIRLFENIKKDYHIYFMGNDSKNLDKWKKKTRANLDKFEINRNTHTYTGDVWPYTDILIRVEGEETDGRHFWSWISIKSILEFEKKS